MVAIRKATHKIRTTRSSCYLTHGGSTYDHKGLNKARRLMDRAAILEQLDTESDEPTTTTTGTTFRLIITTQVYENYGAHCWDGNGHCPQYWKAKGGNQYHRTIGNTNDVITTNIDELVKEIKNKVERDTEYYNEYVIDWYIATTTEETYSEQSLREMLEYEIINQTQYDHSLKQLSI